MNKKLSKAFTISVLSLATCYSHAGGLIDSFNKAVNGLNNGLNTAIDKANNTVGALRQGQNIPSTTIQSTTSTTPSIVNGDTLLIRNPIEKLLYEFAAVEDRNPSLLTGKKIYDTLEYNQSLLYGPETSYLRKLYESYKSDSNTFSRQDKENTILQKIRPLYQAYRGYNKVIMISELGSKDFVPISHYDLDTKSFYVSRSNNKFCSVDIGARGLFKVQFYGHHGGIFQVKPRRQDACQVYVPDQNLARKIESWITNRTLRNKDITVVLLARPVVDNTGLMYYFDYGALRIADPTAAKPTYIITKPILQD